MPKKNVELSQEVKGNGKKKKRKSRRILSKLMTLFIFVSLGLLIYQIIELNLLPTNLLVLISLVFSFIHELDSFMYVCRLRLRQLFHL